MSKIVKTEVSLEVLACATCKMLFAPQADAVDRLRQCGNVFYCPSGHKNVFAGGESREKKLERLLSAANTRNEELQRELQLAKKRAGRKR